jgi:hypothetical protein
VVLGLKITSSGLDLICGFFFGMLRESQSSGRRGLVARSDLVSIKKQWINFRFQDPLVVVMLVSWLNCTVGSA